VILNNTWKKRGTQDLFCLQVRLRSQLITPRTIYICEVVFLLHEFINVLRADRPESLFIFDCGPSTARYARIGLRDRVSTGEQDSAGDRIGRRSPPSRKEARPRPAWRTPLVPTPANVKGRPRAALPLCGAVARWRWLRGASRARGPR